MQENPDASWKVDYKLQPLSEIHYNGEIGIFNNSRAAADKKTLGALGILGFFLLLLACFNFINLETAKSALRAKEIGVRKVLGSNRNNIILQLISETTFLTCLSLIISIPLIYLTLPLFEEFLPPDFAIDFYQPHLIGATALLIILVSFLSGLYPAWLASASNPSLTIRQGGLNSVNSKGRGIVRKALVSIQFFLVQILILGTLVVYQQTQFVINKDMGFSKDAILHFELPYYQNQASKELFKSQLDQIAGVEESSLFDNPPAHNGWSTSIMNYEQDGKMIEIDVHQKRGDTAYLGLFDIPLIAGRNVRAHDSISEYVINETLARSMGFDQPSDAVGSTLENSDELIPIVGIAKDFHVLNLHEAIKPVALSYHRGGGLGVKVGAGHWKTVDKLVDQAKILWSTQWPEDDFSMAFMDESIENLYKQEKRTSKLIVSVTGLALFISCLGLLGLVGFLAHQRTREIGIRKVLGASTFNIVHVFTKDFLIWVIIAIIPATIVGLFIMNRWLEQFAYTFDLNLGTILMAASLCLIAAVSTVVVQSLRAARVNPALSLKNE